MAEDLTPKLVRSYDSAELGGGGQVRNVTIVEFMVGRLGPFQHVFDRNPSAAEMQQVMQAKANSLIGLV